MRLYLLTVALLTSPICLSAENMSKISKAEVKILCQKQADDLQKNKTTASFSKNAYSLCLNEYVKLGAVDSSILEKEITQDTQKIPQKIDGKTSKIPTQDLNDKTKALIGTRISYDGMNQPDPKQLQEILVKNGFSSLDYSELDLNLNLPDPTKHKKTKHKGYPFSYVVMNKTQNGIDGTILVYLAKSSGKDWLFSLLNNGTKSGFWTILDITSTKENDLSYVQLTSVPDCKFGSKKIQNWIALLPTPKIKGDYCKSGKTLEWKREDISGNLWSISSTGKLVALDINEDASCFSKSKDKCKSENDNGDI